MNDGFNIKTLGNQQLGFHYKVTHQKLNDVKIAIVDNIIHILGKTPGIDFETYKNTEKFHNYCKKFRPNIENQKKELFLILMKQQTDIHKEIIRRQLQMLKEIRITTPSIRVLLIIEQMQGGYFPMFDYLIKYIKLAKKGKINKRPKEKKIEIPNKLIQTFENLGTNITTVLYNNSGPMPN